MSLQVAGARVPLSSNKTLIDVGVYDGTVLLLQMEHTSSPQAEHLPLHQFVPTSAQPNASTGGIGVPRPSWEASVLRGVIPDVVDLKICEGIARALAPLSLVEAGAQQDLSQDIRLLEVLHLPAAEAFAIAETWRARERSELLRVPIGVRADGEPLLIDLKEAAEGGMGPHGLVIGATGSGKSELLRTLIVSLVVTHDPETVNFVLIDFKGGASFAMLPVHHSTRN